MNQAKNFNQPLNSSSYNVKQTFLTPTHPRTGYQIHDLPVTVIDLIVSSFRLLMPQNPTMVPIMRLSSASIGNQWQTGKT